MSMLAEKKRKVKWCLNPNGNLWLKDNNKFGQKMLEKMGWAPGKGLGAREQGITSAVRPKINASGRGLGFSAKDNFWMEHQEEFSALLSDLNQGQTAEIKNTSLEERSKLSRGRVHYKKFARGKDVSRYTVKDLSAIIGKAALSVNTDDCEVSMTETYFNMKENEIESIEDKLGLNDNELIDNRLMSSEPLLEDSETLESQDTFSVNCNVNHKGSDNKTSKKKKKKKNQSPSEESEITEQNEQMEENSSSQIKSGSKKRKKRGVVSESFQKKKKCKNIE